ncbi:vacuolar transporter chaperone [Podila epigama]|nr:vacuolar transporter chaperone [Podila epigama]
MAYNNNNNSNQPSLRQQQSSRPSYSQYSAPPLSPPPFQPSFSQQQQQQQQQQPQQLHQAPILPPVSNYQLPQHQGLAPPNQQSPFRPQTQYQPQSQFQPQTQYQPQSQYQPKSQYQQKQPAQQQQQQQQQRPFPLPTLSANEDPAAFVPLIPLRQQSANIPLNSPGLDQGPSSAFNSFNNNSSNNITPSQPYSRPDRIETIESLEPPHNRFGSDSASGNRPYSVASISNLSTHSNEPLNPPQKPTPTTRKFSRKNIRGMNYGKSRPAPSQDRSITPQPWHPGSNVRRQGNNLDLPEDNDKHRMERIDDSDGDEGDQAPKDDRRKVRYPDSGSGKTRIKPRFFSRMRDRLRVKLPADYKVTGTGRVAQFSNERLYLHWIRFGILQGGIAVTLLSYGIGIASYIGIGALLLALTTLIYSTALYHVRHLFMITKRPDAIYFERWIPTFLTLGLIALYTTNFILTMSIGQSARSPAPWTTYGSAFDRF